MKHPERSIRRRMAAALDQLALLPWTPWGPDLLDPEAFRGRRVVIIGPAETVIEELENVDVDTFDVVVRLNNGLGLSAADPPTLGRRTDILVHNLREDGDRSAGAIPVSVLRAYQVGQVVYPHWRTPKLRRIYKAKQAELRRDNGPPLRLIPPSIMVKLRSEIGDRPPTVGVSAIAFFLASPVAELAIYGFTFFETPYVSGYNNAVVTAADARHWVDARGAHEPLSEKAAIRKRLAASDKPPITLGRHVARHLAGAVL